MLWIRCALSPSLNFRLGSIMIHKPRPGEEKQGHLFLRKMHESSTNAGMCFLEQISKAGTRGYEKSCGFNLSLKYWMKGVYHFPPTTFKAFNKNHFETAAGDTYFCVEFRCNFIFLFSCRVILPMTRFIRVSNVFVKLLLYRDHSSKLDSGLA